MEKDQNTNSETQNKEGEEIKTGKLNNDAEEIKAEELNNDAEENKAEELNNDTQTNSPEDNKQIKEVTPEEKILELEDKVARAFAEMQNLHN